MQDAPMHALLGAEAFGLVDRLRRLQLNIFKKV